MCPFAVAALGFRYLSINFSVMFGHPLRKPRRTALRSVEILGLHRDWWANLTALTRVRTECVNAARDMCGARSKQGPGRGRTLGPGAVHTFLLIGNVHKSVDGSLCPRKITLLSNTTSHFLSSKITLHPALHSGRIPMSDATVSDGTICPVKMVGKPGIVMSHMCDDFTCFPSGRLIVRGDVATRLLTTSMPSIMNMDVAPVSAMAWSRAIVTVFNN